MMLDSEHRPEHLPLRLRRAHDWQAASGQGQTCEMSLARAALEAVIVINLSAKYDSSALVEAQLGSARPARQPPAGPLAWRQRRRQYLDSWRPN